MNQNIYLTAFLTILRKEATRFLRIWTQTLLPPVITMTLYFVIFGQLLGNQIGKIDGYNYIQYIAPGLIMMAIITNAYGNVSSSFFGIKFQKSIEELIVAPIPNSLILLGFTMGGVMRGLAVGILVTFIALLFTHLHVHNFLIIITTALFSTLLFSLAGFTNALFAKKFDDISIIPTFVLAPLTYLAGVFYSIHSLPNFWHTVSLFNPILYMVNAFRYGILGISDISIYVAFFILIVCCLVLFMINLHLLNKGYGTKT